MASDHRRYGWYSIATARHSSRHVPQQCIFLPGAIGVAKTYRSDTYRIVSLCSYQHVLGLLVGTVGEHVHVPEVGRLNMVPVFVIISQPFAIVVPKDN